MLEGLNISLDDQWWDFFLIILVPLILAYACYKVGLLTADGAASSFAVGVIIGAFTNFRWMAALMVFTAIGFAVTYYKLKAKQEKNLQEGKHGERSWKNVWGVSAPCCGFAILFSFASEEWKPYLLIAYISSIAVAASDTVASEIGTRDNNCVLITNFKRVEPGTNGGISITGTVAAFAASAVVTAIAWAILNQEFNLYILIPILSGFAGCLLDSVIGATLETKGYFNKYDNNAFTGIAGGLIGMLILYLV